MEQNDTPNGAAPASLSNGLSLALVLVWAVIVALGGGYVCGLVIERYGEFGALSLWLLGAAAGFIAAKVAGRGNRIAGAILAVAMLAALVVAETCWIHWRRPEGADSWWAAFQWLPQFVQRYEIAAISGGVLTFLGAMSAYRQVTVRSRGPRSL